MHPAVRRSGSMLSIRQPVVEAAKIHTSELKIINPLWLILAPATTFAAETKNGNPLKGRQIRKLGGMSFFDLQACCKNRSETWKNASYFIYAEKGEDLLKAILNDIHSGKKVQTDRDYAHQNFKVRNFWERLPCKLMLFLLKNASPTLLESIHRLPKAKRFDSLLLVYLFNILRQKDENGNKKNQKSLLILNDRGDLEWVNLKENEKLLDPSAYHFILACLNNIIDSGVSEFDDAMSVKRTLVEIMDEFTECHATSVILKNNRFLQHAVWRVYIKQLIAPLLIYASNMNKFITSVNLELKTLVELLKTYQYLQIQNLQDEWGKSTTGQPIDALETFIQQMTPKNVEKAISILRLKEICPMVDGDAAKKQLLLEVLKNSETVQGFDERCIVSYLDYFKQANDVYKGYMTTMQSFISRGCLDMNIESPASTLMNMFKSNIRETLYFKDSMHGMIRSLCQRHLENLSAADASNPEPFMSPLDVKTHMDKLSRYAKRDSMRWKHIRDFVKMLSGLGKVKLV